MDKKMTMQAKQSKQEQQLDEIQKTLRHIIKQIRNDVVWYRTIDLRNLEAAEIALDKVTLRKDLD